MRRITCAVFLFACLATGGFGADEGLNPQDLLKRLSMDWPTFNGDYTGSVTANSLKSIRITFTA